jgi:urease accessory protein
MRSRSAFLTLALSLVADSAYAHTGGHPVLSFQSGFLHPLGGLDHLLAMFAVGLLAVQVGGRALGMVPGAFVAMMIVGALIGLTGTEFPGVELGILLSVVAIALPVAFAFGMPSAAAVAYVGFFALFHGFAHGAELPLEGVAAPYIVGFSLASALIHAAGVLVGVGCGAVARGRHAHALRIAGGFVVLAGLGIAAT